MGNITKRGSRGLEGDGALSLVEGPRTELHTELYAAIMREDCTVIQVLLSSHPINQPVTVLANSTSHRFLSTQVPSFLLRHFHKSDVMLRRDYCLMNPLNPLVAFLSPRWGRPPADTLASQGTAFLFPHRN